jgi:hypothetical protein
MQRIQKSCAEILLESLPLSTLEMFFYPKPLIRKVKHLPSSTGRLCLHRLLMQSVEKIEQVHLRIMTRMSDTNNP